MKRVQIIPITSKGEEILRSNTDKFGMKKYQAKLLKKVGDRYTTTEIIDKPFSIVISIKPEYEVYISSDVILDKTLIAVGNIMRDHNGSLKDVSVEVKND